MVQYIVKIVVTAILVVAIAEISKKWTFFGAVVASLPLTSLLAMVWLYLDTGSVEKVSQLSVSIFWVVVPSLIFFIVFPVFIKMGWQFWLSLSAAVACTAVGYGIYIKVLNHFGVV